MLLERGAVPGVHNSDDIKMCSFILPCKRKISLGKDFHWESLHKKNRGLEVFWGIHQSKVMDFRKYGIAQEQMETRVLFW